MVFGFIYTIKIEGRHKLYVGSTINLDQRWYHHRWMLRNNCHHSIHLQRAVNKYGWERLRFSVLENVYRLVMVEREQFWINHLSGRLYNMAPTAGTVVGLRKTPEQKEKSARFHRGRKRTDETKKLMSIALTQWRIRTGNRNRGTTANPQRDAAISGSYFSARSYFDAGIQFGIGAPAAFHAANRFRRRLEESLIAASLVFEGLTVPKKIHPDWSDLAA